MLAAPAVVVSVAAVPAVPVLVAHRGLVPVLVPVRRELVPVPAHLQVALAQRVRVRVALREPVVLRVRVLPAQQVLAAPALAVVPRRPNRQWS